MNTEMKSEWLAALRSGDYEQARGKLKNFDSTEFCCLGVLCDLVAKKGDGEWDSTNAYIKFQYEDTASDTVLPIALQRELGIPADIQRELVDMNDDLRFSFDQIADYIELEL